MIEKNSLPAVVESYIVSGNTEHMLNSRKSGMTIFGDIAAALNGEADNIQQLSENLAQQWALKRGLDIAKEYEKKSNLIEKYIKNNPISIAQMEAQQNMDANITSTIIQFGIQAISSLTQNILNAADQ